MGGVGGALGALLGGVLTQGLPVRSAGLASGLLNTSRLIGSALGLAALSTIVASLDARQRRRRRVGPLRA
jgi:hypothetical protein